MTKTEMRRWMKRCRENLRDAEKLLQTYVRPEDCEDALYDLFADLSGAAGELQSATDKNDYDRRYDAEGNAR